MSDVDPLIKREMQWMALGVLENRDLAPIIIAKVRRRRIRRTLVSIFGVFAVAATSIGIYEVIQRPAPIIVASDNGFTGANTNSQPEIIGLQSDYPVTWEPVPCNRARGDPPWLFPDARVLQELEWIAPNPSQSAGELALRGSSRPLVPAVRPEPSALQQGAGAMVQPLARAGARGREAAGLGSWGRRC